jgi:hypothetical protein
VSDITWGWTDEDGGFHWANGKNRLLASYHDNRIHRWSVPLYLIESHLQGEAFFHYRCGKIKTLYYTAAWRKAEPYALITIDIDILKRLKKGSREGALAFARFLARFFPGVVFEQSTSGKGGVHMHLIIDKLGWSSEDVREALTHLEKWLQVMAVGHDIEKVEVKGKPPVLHWRQGFLEDINCGVFCRLPRVDIRGTTILTLDDIYALKMPEAQVTEKSPGSSYVIPQDFIDRKHEYLDLAQKLLCSWRPVCAGREIVVREDVACFAMLLDYFTETQRNGAMPHRRFAIVWQLLFQAGVFNRAFSNKRHAELTRMFSALGLINWEDHTYTFSLVEGEKGRCCKWAASDRFYLLLSENTAAGRHHDGNSTLTVNPDYLRPTLIFRLEDDDLPSNDDILRLLTPVEEQTRRLKTG